MSFALTIDQNESVQLRGADGEAILAKPVPISGVNAGPDPVFVFRPGGVTSANVYATQAELRTAMLASLGNGPRWLQIDGSITGLTVTFSGVVDFLDDTTIVPRTFETLNFAAGATIVNVTKLAVDDEIFLQNNGTVVWTIVGSSSIFNIKGIAGFSGSAGAAFLAIPAGTVLSIVIIDGGGIGDAVNAAISGAGLLGLTNLSGIVASHAIGAGLTWQYSIDAASETQQPQGSTPAFTYVAPPNILQELDAAGHGAAATNTSTSTGTIRQLFSGRTDVRVAATFTQGGGAPGVVTMSVQRDGVTIVGAPTYSVSIPNGSLATLAIDWVDTLPDALTHHYGWTATTSAGTIAVAGGQAEISVVEQK